jgi:beta-glucosidase
MTSVQESANGLRSAVVERSITDRRRRTPARAGEEVATSCSARRSKVERPREDLRGYARVTLSPGQTRTVEFVVPASSLAYWDVATHAWVVEPDAIRFRVGASSSDIRLEQTVNVVP